MPLLKLLALDNDDLEVISACLQDSIVKAKNLVWKAGEKRFVAGMYRFSRKKNTSNKLAAKNKKTVCMRHWCALRFDHVLAVQTSGIDHNKTGDILSLLALRFYIGQAPGGTVEFVFSGKAALRLEVECIETQLTDLGPVWQTDRCPSHP